MTVTLVNPKPADISDVRGPALLTGITGGQTGPPGPAGAPGEPGAPGGSDASFAAWVADETPSATYAAVLDLIRAKAPSPPTFRVDDYGAVGDGTTADDAAFAAAKAAATTAGGGTILLGPHRYRLDAMFTPGEGNSLRAPMNALAVSITKYCIVLGSASAYVKLGGDSQGRGGNHGNFNVDANGTGSTAGAVQLTVNDQVVAPITVQDAPGVGYLIFACQNSKILQPAVDQCQDNVVIDGGSGGLTIENMHSTSPTRYGLLIHDSNPGGHPSYGYQFGPADILFIKPLVEQYTGSASALIRINSGTRIKFEQPGLSVNGQTLTGHVVELTNDNFPSTTWSEAEFSSGNYHGGPIAFEKIFYVKGTNAVTFNKLVVNGQSFFQQSTALFTTDAGGTLGAIDDEQFTITGTVSAVFDSGAPASAWFFWRKAQRTGIILATPDAATAWTGHVPLAIRKSTDGTSGARFYIQNDGTMGWANGTNFVGLVTATPDLTNRFLILSGVKHSGKVVSTITSQSVAAAGTALTTDVSTTGPRHGLLLSSAGTVTSWTLTNPVEGQHLSLWVHRAGAQTFAWPTNINWDTTLGVPAAPAAGHYLQVHLVYLSAISKWVECGPRLTVAST